jgi:8-oxo-dGTP pyrophosphatase MutT (NUDIX family)
VLLRNRPEGSPEVLLIQRHMASRFAPGDFVFPGGKIKAEDTPDDAETWCVGMTAERARARLGDLSSARLALGHWVGVIRETFEEIGILLTYGEGGSLLRLNGHAPARFEDYRRACQRDEGAFWAMLREERLLLATDRLVYFAHWITPEENPIRFDTRFFVAEAPPEQAAVADNQEIVAVRWLSPAEALDAERRGEISLRSPTIKNLELVEGCSVATVLASLDGQSVPAIRPRVIGEGPGRQVLYPGDAGWY